VTGAPLPGGSRTLERVTTAAGEIALRQAGTDFEIISNGVFLMDTRDGRSERLLVRAALRQCPAASPRLLICGLGFGFSLAEAVAEVTAARIDVAEISPEIIGWHERYLRHLTGAALADSRVSVLRADVAGWLAEPRGPYDIICLDVDNGPEWTVSDANRVLYGNEGLRRLQASLTGRGTLAVWSAATAPGYEQRLRERFRLVRVHRVPVAHGEPDVVYLASGPRAGPGRGQDPARGCRTEAVKGRLKWAG
jgi:spermidine synthase